MRLLIVEDNIELSRLVASGLAAAGYESDIVGSTEEAREAVHNVSYAAMILDLGLPRIDGLTLLRKWREAGQGVPVLVLTARGSWHEKVQGIDSGADAAIGGYLVKSC